MCLWAPRVKSGGGCGSIGLVQLRWIRLESTVEQESNLSIETKDLEENRALLKKISRFLHFSLDITLQCDILTTVERCIQAPMTIGAFAFWAELLHAPFFCAVFE